MRWVRWILLATTVLVLGAAGIFVGGALLSLDWEREHTARMDVLPFVSQSHVDGLVRIDTGSFVFRARVAGLGNTGRWYLTAAGATVHLGSKRE